MAKRSVVVASRISGDGYLAKGVRWFLSEFSSHIWVDFVFAFPSSRQNQCVVFDCEVASWIAQGEEAMPWSHARKTWFLSVFESSEESIHGCTKPKEDILQKLVIDMVELWIMQTRLLDGLLCSIDPRPLLTIPELHYPPVVQASALALHEF